MGLGGAVRRSHQDLALLVGTSYSRPRGRVRPCCCCALLVALLFFVVVIPQMGQLTFHASSSSARSIFFYFFHGPMDTSVSCGGLPLCFPGRAVRKFPRWVSPPQLAVLRTVAICTRVSFLSISITCCYYLLVFCFPAAMWKSVGITSRVVRGLLFLCVSTTRVSGIR